MATDNPPPPRRSARIRDARIPPIVRPTARPLDLPLDIVHSIFAFYMLKSVKFNQAIVDIEGARLYHTEVLRFAGVCRDWHAVSTRQACFAVHKDCRSPLPRRRFRDLLQLLQNQGSSINVQQLSYHEIHTESMAVIPELAHVLNAITSTLVRFSLHLAQGVDADTAMESNIGNMQLLSQSLGAGERLHELRLCIDLPIPLGEYVNMIANIKSLRRCFLEVALPACASANDECETKTWRNYFPHSSTPWHQLTSLFVKITSHSLPLIATILTSGSITHLLIRGSETDDDVPRYSAFEDLWSAIEAYSAPIVSFIFHFSRQYGTSDIPTLDHLLPFLTSCTYLYFCGADLDSMEPLLMLPKLESLAVYRAILHGSSDNGITLGNLLAFTQKLQKPGLLKKLMVTYDSDEFGTPPSTINSAHIDQLKKEANRLKLDLMAWGVIEY